MFEVLFDDNANTFQEFDIFVGEKIISNAQNEKYIALSAPTDQKTPGGI